MKKQTVSTSKAPEATGPFSQAIKAGSFVFTSGQSGHTKSGELKEGVEAQTEQALQNIESIIEEAGGSLQDVVKCKVYVADFGDYDRMNSIYKKYFEEDPPARVGLEAGNLPPDVLVEIEAIAMID